MKDITNAACDETVEQPTQKSIRDQILLSQRPLVSYRTFRHGKSSIKNVTDEEYQRATATLEQDGFGRVVEFTVPRARSRCKVFVKAKPNPWPLDMSVTEIQFDNSISKPIHSDITVPMRNYLENNDYI